MTLKFPRKFEKYTLWDASFISPTDMALMFHLAKQKTVFSCWQDHMAYLGQGEGCTIVWTEVSLKSNPLTAFPHYTAGEGVFKCLILYWPVCYKILYLGVSLVFHRKDLCEARVKPEMSSNLAEEPSSANVLPPRAHKTWQTNLLFLADEPFLTDGPPRVTKLGRWTYFFWQMNLLWQMDPPGYTKFGRQTFFGQWTTVTDI